MPTKPKTFRPAGAPTPQDNRKAYEKQRGSAHQQGYTKAWAKYSRQRLIEHPLCVLCKAEGRIVPATCTDHIKPVRYFPELFWSESNHASLCTRHNVAKGRADARKYDGRGGVISYGD